jgi:hypothetical protein
MRYALLVCADESVAVSDEERARRETAFTRFRDEMRKRGVLHAASGCVAPRRPPPSGAGTTATS